MTGPTGVTERDTFTCKHCQFVVHVKPKEDPASLGGMCKLCMGLICPKCVGKGCAPFERQLEEMERRDAFLKAAGVA